MFKKVKIKINSAKKFIGLLC